MCKIRCDLFSFITLKLGVSTKIKKLIKPRKPKKITEKTEPWKKPIKNFKKPTSSVSIL